MDIKELTKKYQEQELKLRTYRSQFVSTYWGSGVGKEPEALTPKAVDELNRMAKELQETSDLMAAANS